MDPFHVEAVSSAQALRACKPGFLAPAGGAFTWVLPSQKTWVNVGVPAAQLAPGSPHMCGRPNWVSKLARSEAMFGLPNESIIATVTPWPWLPAAYSGERLYEFSIEAGLKQRRWTGTALAQFAWVGGVMLPLSHCASLKVGFGVGSVIAAVCAVAPDGARASAATVSTAPAAGDIRLIPFRVI